MTINLFSERVFARAPLRIIVALLVVVVFGLESLPFAAPAHAGIYAEEQKLTASDGASGDLFGRSVALDGTGERAIVAAAGAASGAGAAYIFSRSGTVWTQEQKLTASDAVAGDAFGTAVAIDSTGTRAVGGAYFGNAFKGAAYVFKRTGTVWAQEQKLTASDGADFDFFGNTQIAIDSTGTRIAVIANNAAVGGTSRGAVYIFTRSGTTWTEEQKLVASDGQDNDTFGSGVALDSDATRVVIGASGVPAGSAYGAAYVFKRTGTVWTEEQKINPAVADRGGFGGNQVGMDSTGTRITLTSPSRAPRALSYVYTRSGTTWALESSLQDDVNGQFSTYPAIDGSGTVIAHGRGTENSNQGYVYTFLRTDTTWTRDDKYTGSDTPTGATLGITTAISGDASRIIVGAGAINTNVGAAYVFSGPAVVAATPTPTPAAVGSYSCFGSLTVSAPSSLHLFLDGQGMSPNSQYTIPCGSHTVSHTAVSDASVTYSGACSFSGSVSITSDTTRTCTLTVTPNATPTPIPSPTPSPSPAPSSSSSLPEGSVISSSPDPDLFIINEHGFKRLFLNPIIFSFYAHLGGWSIVKNVTSTLRDSFITSGLFRNCETNDQKVYALEPTGEDTGTLHHINMTGSQALSEDPSFFKKVFCINSHEFTWYPKSPTPYTSLGQVPGYNR